MLRWWRWALRWGVLAGLLGAAAVVHAHPNLDAARQAYEDGSFRVALSRLTVAEQDPTLTRAQLVQLQWIRAASFHALGQVVEATRALDLLLLLDPLHEPSVADASPPLMAVFEQRRAAWREQHAVTLGPPALNAAGQVTVHLEGKTHEVAAVLAFARAPGNPEYTRVPLKVRGQDARGAITDDALWDACAKTGVVELVLEARNHSGATVARLGNATAPSTVHMPVDPDPVVPPPAPPPPVAPPATPQPGPPNRSTKATPPPAVSVVDPPEADQPGAMMDLPVVANAAPSGAAPATPGADPAAGPPARPPPLVMVGGGLLGLGALTLALGLGAAGVSALFYVALWLVPRGVGQDVSLAYRALLGGWVTGAVVAAVTLGITALLLAGGLGGLLAARATEAPGTR